MALSATLCVSSAIAEELTTQEIEKAGEGVLESVYIDLSGVNKDDSLPKIKQNKAKPKKGDITVLAPAPPLQYVEIDYVASSDIGWKPVTASAFSTTENHGGPVMLVRVLEVGYGSGPIAKMNGAVLSSSQNYENTRLCWGFDGYLTFSCSSGMTLAGYARYYDVSGNQSGTFEYENRSINSPWNTEYDRLYIQ